MAIFYFVAFFFIHVGDFAGAKITSKVFKNNTFSGVIATSVISSIIAMIFFSLITQFNFYIDTRIVLHALILTFNCFVSYITGILVYNYIEILLKSLLSGFLGIVVTVFVSTIVLKETFSFVVLVRMFLMLSSVVISFLSRKNCVKNIKQTAVNTSKKNTKIGIFICVISAILGGVGTINSRYLATYSVEVELATSGTISKALVLNSDYFLTNVMIFVISFIIVLFCLAKNRNFLKLNFGGIKPKYFIVMVSRTIFSNLGTFVRGLLQTILPVLILSPVANAITMISALINSFMFREKITILNIVSIVLSIGAAFLTLVNF